MNTLVTGDDVALAVRLMRDGKPFVIPETAVITAAIVSSDHKRKLSESVAVAMSTAGSNWDRSLVVVVMPSALTTLINETGPALLEIEVAGVYRETWFIEVLIVKGQVNNVLGGV